MKHRAAVLFLAILIAAAAQQSPDFAQLYAQWDSAATSGRFDEISKMLLPGAAVQVGSSRMMFAEMLVQAAKFFQTVTGATQKTTITAANISGTEASLSRTTESSVTIAGQTRRAVDVAEDTWTRTEDGWRLKLSKVISSRELTPATPPDTAQAVASELRLHATAFSTNAASSLDDLNRLGEAIGDARVVALGESTHGTREIQIAKERIIHYLVTRKGFTVLAVEANWPESLAIDNYVKTSVGDPRAYLLNLRMWPLQTPEMMRILAFTRAENEKMASPKLSFSGFDMQDSGEAMEKVLAYCKRTSSTQFQAAEEAYQEVRGLGPRHDGPDPSAQSAAEKARRVVQLLASSQDSSNADLQTARHHAEIVLQATRLRIPGQRPGYRDEMMAANVEWLLNEAHPGEKVILWAHNFHIGFGTSQSTKPMGAWLRSKLGTAYYALGFSVAGGEVRAVGPNGLAVYAMPQAVQDTGDGVLRLSGLPSFFLDLRSLSKTGDLSRWMAAPHSFYAVGALWNQATPESNKSVFAMSSTFDGLIFIQNGHAVSGLAR